MSSTAPVPDRIGRYKIERKIGEGGMGIVYAAHDERLDRTVALKAIRGQTDDTSRQRLWREARAAAGVSHPNICSSTKSRKPTAGWSWRWNCLPANGSARA
jgi:serine/threonine protein kinase